jgi:hypothetical protein
LNFLNAMSGSTVEAGTFDKPLMRTTVYCLYCVSQGLQQTKNKTQFTFTKLLILHRVYDAHLSNVNRKHSADRSTIIGTDSGGRWGRGGGGVEQPCV